MITVGNFYADPQTLKIGQEFIALFGGRFMGSVPDGRLYYTSEDKKDSHLSPYEETVDTTLQIMKDSIASKQNLIIKQWPVLKYKSGCVY